MAVPVDLRILALTATPGCEFVESPFLLKSLLFLNGFDRNTFLSAKQQTIQQVIDNLQISTLEYRNEDDHDVCPYIHNRKIELIQVHIGSLCSCY